MTFETLKHVHIIGVCGTLMGAFAAYLKRQGIQVSGSDQNIYPPMSDVLSRAQVTLFNGYSAGNLMATGSRPDLVVIGNVIVRDNPEARAAIDGGYAYSSLPEAMEKLFLPKTRNIVVAGTHGKTTTSSLLAFVLSQTGMDPNYFIGGASPDLPNSFHVSLLKEGHPFVLEGDEYDTAFWDKVPKFNHYLPKDVILTSVEYDHADIYPDMAAVVRAFEGLLKRISPNGKLIACTDYPHIRGLIEGYLGQVISYGLKDARFTPRNVRSDGGKNLFEILDNGKKVGQLELQIPGTHNVLNALAVWIESRELGLSSDAIQGALAKFRGVKRRQEERGEIQGVLVIDDFAHHPTAVRETLRALRTKYPDRKLTAVFEPRSATSRRKIFQKDYAQAFVEADSIFIAIPYDQSKIAVSDQFSSEQLVSDIQGLGKKSKTFSTVDQGVLDVASSAAPGDLIAVLSNGGFGGFIPKLLEALGKR